MTDDPERPERTIEIEIEVPGTPHEVWPAIATGPGVSSWYVPHQIEQHQGGRADASFGPGPEMQAPGTVAVWEPPHRFTTISESEGAGLTFEWTVEAKERDSCIVRLTNSGFGDGDEWDAQYDTMASGWAIFLTNLRLHLEYFAPEPATAMLPMATWAVDRATAWNRLTDALRIPSAAGAGDRITVEPSTGAPALSALVVQALPQRYSLLIDDPAPGTGFIASEGQGEFAAVSAWFYLYGPDGRAAATRDEPGWRRFLEELGSAEPPG